MEELLNKTITKVEIGEDGTGLVFTLSDGETVSYEAYGDCCSTSWFSNITGLQNLLGQEIIEITEREEWSDEEQKKAEEEYKRDNDYEPERLALYGYLLKTRKGTCDVEFRNESNGYYGGSADFTIRKFKDLKEVTEDF